MTFGLTCVNDSGELTLSSDAYTLNYLGKATFVSSSDFAGSSTASTAGGSVWSFNWAGPIVCAIGLKSSGQAGVRITSVARSSTSSSAWTINVKDYSTTSTGPSGDTSAYSTQRTDSDIYVFGFPLAANLPNYGFAMFNAAGVLTCDLSKPILGIKTRIALATDAMSQSVGSFTKPAVIGYPAGLAVTSSGPISTLYRNTTYRSVWKWTNDGSLYRVDVVEVRSLDDGPFTPSSVHEPCGGILIEANGLT
jgi:hypothetical protein